jgi:hypothetical protein
MFDLIRQLENFHKSDAESIVIFVGKDPYDHAEICEWAKKNEYVCRSEYLCEDIRVNAFKCSWCEMWNILNECKVTKYTQESGDLFCPTETVAQCKNCREDFWYYESHAHKYANGNDIELEGEVILTGKMLIMKKCISSYDTPYMPSEYKVIWWGKSPISQDDNEE